MNATINKTFLFVFQHAPHATLQAKEGLDFAFSCAAFDQKVDVLFIHDGVYQLLNNQNTKSIQSKNHSASIDALSLYGIENCFYQQTSAGQRKVDSSQLKKNCKSLGDKECHDLLKTYDFVFNY
jgi:tRNA 2-thiouridine synthesizing protein C